MDKIKLQKIIMNSNNKLQVLKELGFKTHSGNYRTLDKYIKLYNLDTSHFNPYASRKSNPKRWKFEDIFCKESKAGHSGTYLKSILYQNKIKKQECEICGIKPDEWVSGRISLILDHINGDRKDHRLENLRIICPNCDSTLSTYTGRNKNKTA